MPARRASKGRRLAQNALDALVNYSWPGNVRELEHLIQRLMIFAGGYTIQAHDLPWTLRTDPQAPAGEANPSGEEQWLSLIRAHLTSYARRPCLRGTAGEDRDDF